MEKAAPKFVALAIGKGEVGSGARVAGGAQAFPVLLSSTLPVLGVVALAPNLPTFFSHFSGTPNVQLLVPMLLMIPALCNVVLSWLTGVATDHWGRRRLLIWATLIHGVFGMMPLLIEDLRWILATRVMVGVAEAILWTAGSSLIGDYFQGADRRKWLALQDGAAPVLQTAVILAAGALGTISWHLPFWIYAVSLFCCIWLLISTWEPDQPQVSITEVTSAAFPWRTAMLVGAVTLFTATIFFVQVLQLGLIFAKLGAGTPLVISVSIAIASAGVIAGAFIYRKIGQNHVGKLLALVFLLDGVAYVAFSAIPGYKAGIAIAAICQVANGITMPTLVGWALSRFHFSIRGRGMGIWTSCLFSGQFVSALVVTTALRFTDNILTIVAAIGVVSLIASTVAFIAGVRGSARSLVMKD
jgi:MFS family permease